MLVNGAAGVLVDGRATPVCTRVVVVVVVGRALVGVMMVIMIALLLVVMIKLRTWWITLTMRQGRHPGLRRRQ